MRIPNFYRKRLDKWLDKRAPLATQHKLAQHNLYTFPNLTGLGLCITILIIWLMGTNYQNNLVLGIAYLLISFFVVAIWQAYANVAGLEIKAVTTQPGFAGDNIRFTLQLITPNPSGCEHLELSWPGGKKIIADLDCNTSIEIEIPCPSHHRGFLFPGRLLIESRYPLGVIRCWTHINLDMVGLVFPKPVAGAEPEHSAGEEESEKSNHKKGGDDPGTLRNYQPGDSLKHIAWKLFARERGLHTKQNEQTLSNEKWLDWSGLSLPQEKRLSVLCYWALQYEQAGIQYGLLLPEKKITPNTGYQHLQAVLSELAVFGLKKPMSEKKS
jgi:uncharacterized protein (DUF58 family)